MANKIMINWRPKFSQTIRSRGMDYYNQGKVKNVKRDGNYFLAEVKGKGKKVYHTGAQLSADLKSVSDLTCTCPYSEDGFNCKHEAALMYYIEKQISSDVENLMEKEREDGNNIDAIKALSNIFADSLGGYGYFVDKDGHVGYKELEQSDKTADSEDSSKSKRTVKPSKSKRSSGAEEKDSKEKDSKEKDSKEKDSKENHSKDNNSKENDLEEAGATDELNEITSSNDTEELNGTEGLNGTGELNDTENGSEAKKRLQKLSQYRYYNYSQILKDAKIDAKTWARGLELIKNKHIRNTRFSITTKPAPSFWDFEDNGERTGDKLCIVACKVDDTYYETTINVGPSYFDGGKCYVFGCEKSKVRLAKDGRLSRLYVCEHQAALLYLLKDYIDNNLSGVDATDKNGEALMERISNKSYNTSKSDDEAVVIKHLYDIEPVLTVKNSGTLALSIRAGADKKYKIQRLNEFYHAVIDNKSMKIGKQYCQFSLDTLSEHGLKWFKLLENIAVDSSYKTFSNRLFSYTKEPIIDLSEYKDEIYIYGHIIDDFYDTAVGENIAFNGNIGKYEKNFLYKTITMADGRLKATINIDNMKDASGSSLGVHITGKVPVLFHGKNYDYYIEKGKLNRVDKDSSRKLAPFSSVNNDGEIDFKIGLRNLSRFYYETLPWLRENANVTFNDSDFIDDYLLPQPKFSFYMDREKGLVTCKAIVNYDDIERNISDEHAMSEGFRDLSKEKEIAQIVRYYFPKVSAVDAYFYCEEAKDEDLLYELFLHGLDELQSIGDVRHTESFKSIRIRKKPNFNIGVSLNSSIMDLDITSQDMTNEELIELLDSYKKKKKFYRLHNGDFISFESEAVERLSQMMDELPISLKDFVDGKMQLPAYRALYVDKMLEDQSDIYEQRDKRFKKLIQEFKTISDADFELPNGIKGDLRKYQRDGYRWLCTLSKYGFGGILADEMGLGKTLQTITMLMAYYESFDNMAGEKEDQDATIDGRKQKPSIVVVPASLVYNWGEELRHFAPSLKYVLISGSKKEREDIILNIESYDVVVTSYDLLKRDIAEYEGHSFAYEIIDEAQYIKNHLSLAAKSVKLINAERKYALTGTPIENRLSELWSIFDYLMPGLLYGYEQFRSEFELPVMKLSQAEPMDRLRSMVTPFILRRKKADVLKDLPEKLEEIRYARMDEEQQKLYDAQVVHMKTRLEKQSDDEFMKSKIEILAELTKLRQICCDPSLCFDNYKSTSCKTDAFMDMIEQVIEGEHKALVFSQFVSMLEILRKRLDDAGIAYYMITGSTPKEKRIELVNSFNGDDTPVFLISLKAGGTGLNLTGADVVIHYDPWWNLAVQNQATDRAHRIGQQKVVTVFKLIAHGTIEDKIVEMQEKKRELAESILESEGISSASLSKDDLLELLG